MSRPSVLFIITDQHRAGIAMVAAKNEQLRDAMIDVTDDSRGAPVAQRA